MVYHNIYIFLIGGQLLYNVVLVSPAKQCELAISIHTTLGDSEGQGNPACCNTWSLKESDMI